MFSSASILSPSVTATLRMLSPKLASLILRSVVVAMLSFEFLDNGGAAVGEDVLS